MENCREQARDNIGRQLRCPPARPPPPPPRDPARRDRARRFRGSGPLHRPARDDPWRRFGATALRRCGAAARLAPPRLHAGATGTRRVRGGPSARAAWGDEDTGRYDACGARARADAPAPSRLCTCPCLRHCAAAAAAAAAAAGRWRTRARCTPGVCGCCCRTSRCAHTHTHARTRAHTHAISRSTARTRCRPPLPLLLCLRLRPQALLVPTVPRRRGRLAPSLAFTYFLLLFPHFILLSAWRRLGRFGRPGKGSVTSLCRGPVMDDTPPRLKPPNDEP
jgi:hypothetical protein